MEAHQYDNKMIISIANSYLHKYEKLVCLAKTLKPITVGASFAWDLPGPTFLLAQLISDSPEYG